jgi:hypothetical protein
MKIVFYKAEDTVAKKGTLQNYKIMIIIEGVLKMRKTNMPFKYKGEVIGDMASNEVFDDDLIC